MSTKKKKILRKKRRATAIKKKNSIAMNNQSERDQTKHRFNCFNDQTKKEETKTKQIYYIFQYIYIWFESCHHHHHHQCKSGKTNNKSLKLWKQFEKETKTWKKIREWN